MLIFASQQSLLKLDQAINTAELGGFDEANRGHAYMMQLAVEVPAPKVEKFLEFGKTRGKVEVLPDIGLQERRMIGQAVEDLGCGEPEIV